MQMMSFLFGALNALGLKRKLGHVVLVKIAGIIAGFIATLVMARTLGAEQFGIYTYVFTLVMILSIVNRLGFDNMLIRYISNLRVNDNFAEMKSLLRSSSVVTVALSFVIGLGVALYCYFAISETNLYRNTMIIGVVLCLPFLSIAYNQRAQLNGLKLIALSELPIMVVRHLSVVLIIVTTIALGMSLAAEEMMITTACAFALISVIGYIIVSRALPSEYHQAQAPLNVISWSKKSLTFLLINVSNTLNQRLDILVLGAFSTPKEVGIYAVVSRLLPILSFASSVVNTTLKPHISELYTTKKIKPLQNIVFSTSAGVFLITAALALVLFVFGKYILALFGEEYVAGLHILMILVAAKLFAVVVGPVAIILVMCDQQKIASVIELVSNIAYFLLLLVLVSKFGALGAALSTAMIWVFRNLSMSFYVHRNLNLNASVFNLEKFRGN